MIPKNGEMIAAEVFSIEDGCVVHCMGKPSKTEESSSVTGMFDAIDMLLERRRIHSERVLDLIPCIPIYKDASPVTGEASQVMCMLRLLVGVGL